MKQLVKMQAAMLLIAMSLTSDTAATSVVPISTSLSNSVSTGQRHPYLVCRKLTTLLLTLPSKCRKP